MTSSIMVGCPIRDRKWAVPTWAEHARAAVRTTERFTGALACRFVFVGDPRTDPETFEEVAKLPEAVVVEVPESGATVDHAWYYERYVHMADLRNVLLRRVRGDAPDYFWSLDSDVFAHADSLLLALSSLETDVRGFAAMGQKCFMAPGDWCTSNAILTPFGGMVRETVEGVIPVDVIMAAKVMSPTAYMVDYEPHRQGEDVGWSLAARQKGCLLGWDGRVTSNHVMVRPTVAQ